MEYTKFTKSMKRTHKILVPDMLPIHFSLIISILKSYGYDLELLQTSSREVVDEGLKNVHNDTCYPALLVIGQFINAFKSGKYNPRKTAVLITQTGGGCRASNYIFLLRKALAREYPEVPVISLNFSGLEKGSGFKLSLSMITKLAYAALYGDMLMSIYNQSRPYEVNKGDSATILQNLQGKICLTFNSKRYKRTKSIYRMICNDFSNMERTTMKKPRVGIVGEIYVKYSPLANNHLEDFLISEGCEPVVPGLLDFCLYCIVNNLNDHKLYKMNKKTYVFWKIVYRFLYKKQKEQIMFLSRDGRFDAPHDFEELRHNADTFIHQGVKMGEGWLIPAEMASLAKHHVNNIVCAQPFGCLPNHIVGKGMIRPIKDAFPKVNIAAIDYDPGATKVNQENRIKLMLANINK